MSGATSEAIAAFWAWWPSAAPTFAASFSSGEHSDELIERMNDHVKAIDDRLDWEFGPGTTSAHHLCLSGRGDPELRVIAERWRERAPPADATWAYHGARQAHPGGGLKLTIGGVDVALDDLRLELDVDDDRGTVDVVAWHPAFADVADERLRRQIVFIGLDTLLGEDELERWLGRLSIADEPIEDGAPPAALREAIAELASTPAENRWQLLRGESDGKPLIVAVNRAVRRVDHWLKDTLMTVRVTLSTANEDGMPAREESELLNDAEDGLIDSLGPHAVYVARETHGGARKLLFHVEESGPAADIASRWSPSPAHVVECDVRRDVAWEILGRWG